MYSITHKSSIVKCYSVKNLSMRIMQRRKMGISRKLHRNTDKFLVHNSAFSDCKKLFSVIQYEQHFNRINKQRCGFNELPPAQSLGRTMTARRCIRRRSFPKDLGRIGIRCVLSTSPPGGIGALQSELGRPAAVPASVFLFRKDFK